MSMSFFLSLLRRRIYTQAVCSHMWPRSEEVRLSDCSRSPGLTESSESGMISGASASAVLANTGPRWTEVEGSRCNCLVRLQSRDVNWQKKPRLSFSLKDVCISGFCTELLMSVCTRFSEARKSVKDVRPKWTSVHAPRARRRG